MSLKLLLRTIIILASFIIGCKSPIARRPVTVQSGSFIKESIARNKALNKKEKTHIDQIVAKDTSHNYISSKNGFLYYYTKKDSIESPKPEFGSIVNFDYNIKDLSGNVIYSKEELSNQNYRIDKEKLFYGLREGLKLMQAGESVTFIFPSNQAYGYYGDNKKIKRNMPLISEVTVNSISKL